MNPLLTKNYVASGAIARRRLVKPAAAGAIALAAAATDALCGVSAELDVVSGERVDVHLAGLIEVEFGGAVAAGAPVTANAEGKAVAAAPGAGANVRIAGFAHGGDYVAGDVGLVLFAPGVMQGA